MLFSLESTVLILLCVISVLITANISKTHSVGGFTHVMQYVYMRARTCVAYRIHIWHVSYMTIMKVINMSKTTTMLLIGALFIAGAGMLATAGEVQAAYGYGGCPGYGGGYGAAYYGGDQSIGYPEVVVTGVDDALNIAKADIDPDVKEGNIYAMGRWWVVQYVDDEGTIVQNYIDAFTGDVVDLTDQSYTYAPGGYGRMHGYGQGMMNGYGHGYGMMGNGGMYRY